MKPWASIRLAGLCAYSITRLFSVPASLPSFVQAKYRNFDKYQRRLANATFDPVIRGFWCPGLHAPRSMGNSLGQEKHVVYVQEPFEDKESSESMYDSIDASMLTPTG